MSSIGDDAEKQSRPLASSNSEPTPASNWAASPFDPLDERRQATRFPREPATDFAVVWQTPGEEILAEVHDESLTGLGILLADVSTLQLGSKLDVVYTGSLMRGEVRHIERRDDGRYLVGLRCESLLPKK